VTAASPPSPRLALAFDFGTRIIGVACGDTLTRTAGARPALPARGGEPDWPAIRAAILDLDPDILVVGAPRNMDGTPSAMTRAAHEFGLALARRFALPVEEVDERGSSLEAAAVLKAARADGSRRRRVSREAVDSAAAAVILRRWFAGEGRPLTAVPADAAGMGDAADAARASSR
jgi:putative Holliday junction resolvase